jgi:tRNA (cytidine56-2'-O)-methyltransferase
MKIIVLRIGHRKKRDIRVTTHCCLVARAFLADEMVLSGEEDLGILETVRKVAKNWGGKFRISYEANFHRFLKERKLRGWKICHLTMYGELLKGKIDQIRQDAKKGLVVVIGAEKVPAEVYSLADYNIAVTSQPHSEVAALGVFLNELNGGVALKPEAQRNFTKAKLIIEPGLKARKIRREK